VSGGYFPAITHHKPFNMSQIGRTLLIVKLHVAFPAITHDKPFNMSQTGRTLLIVKLHVACPAIIMSSLKRNSEC